MFCLPQSTAFCTSGSPGSESCVFWASCSREAILAANAADGFCSSLVNSCCAGPRSLLAPPWSEPATPSHTVFEPSAGRESVYVSSPPVPLPNGPSSQAEGLGSAGAPGSVPVHR